MRKLLPFASLLVLATVPNTALAQEVSGMVSVNTSQLFKDGFHPSGDNPTIKAVVNVSIGDGAYVEGFLNKEFGGTLSDEIDGKIGYRLPIDDDTSVNFSVSYDWMRELPDIIDTTIQVSHKRFTVSATRYTLPQAPDGYRLEASYRLNPLKKVTVNAGVLHEGGLGLPKSINALVIDPSIELKSRLFLDGRVVLPVNGDPVKAALSLRFAF